tara:strand:+ start:149 stop:955 length:807 start_codon:yes stop_codon:yes gene_type:complete
MLIDTHVHLDEFQNHEVSDILDRAIDVGVGFVISAGTTIETSYRSIELSNTFDRFFSGVGIHPMDIKTRLTDKDFKILADLASGNDKVLVMSEIGLDYLDGMPDREWQFPAFRSQIGIARELNLPIIFHSREAHEDSLRVLREERAFDVGGVMHYFQGNMNDAKQAIDLGFYISIARPIFRIEELRDVVKELPLENIVVETDSFPQHFKKNRDNWTEPRHIKSIIDEIAFIKNNDVNDVENIIYKNTKDMLAKKWDIVATYVPEISCD